MSRYMKSVTAFLLLFLSFSGYAKEPSCEYFGPTLEEQVFGYISSGIAIVTATAISESYTSGEGSITKFRIREIFKEQTGGLVSSEVNVFTYYPRTLKYSKGEIYLMYLTYGGMRQLQTNICMGTKRLSEASKEELQIINEIPNK